MKNGPFLSLAVILVAALFPPWASGQQQRQTVKLTTSVVSLGRFLSGGIAASLTVSPDSRRVAYAAARGGKVRVVVDAVEGKEYDNVAAKETILSSPDGKRVAYAAKRAHKWMLVVDGVEGKECGGLLRGSRIVFDGPSSLYALARRAGEFFRVDIECH